MLRDGRHVATRPTGELDERELVQMMIGGALAEYFPPHVAGRRRATSCCASKGCRARQVRGRLVLAAGGRGRGLAGLVGAGRSEVAQALFGLDPEATGDVVVDGPAASRSRSPREAIALGIGLVPEDRKRQGLVLSMRALEQLDAADAAAAVALRLAPRAAPSGRSRPTLFDRLRVRAPGLDTSSPGCRAATSRRSCSRSGSRRAAGC